MRIFPSPWADDLYYRRAYGRGRYYYLGGWRTFYLRPLVWLSRALGFPDHPQP